MINGGAMLVAGVSAYSSVGTRRPRAMKNAMFSYSGPNSEIVYDLRELRAVCRDLYYNNADARTIVETYVDYAIGRGQRAQSVPKRSVLIPKLVEQGMTAEQAEAMVSDFAARAREDFDAWAKDKKSTTSQTMNYYTQTRLTLRTEGHSGEAFCILNRETQPDGSIELNVGLIEPDRVMDWRPPTDRNVMGLILDDRGRPQQIKVRKNVDNIYDRKLDTVDFVSPVSGRQRILHMFQPIRAGQVRGVPMYAQNILTFRDLADLKKNELRAGVVNSYFATTVESPDPAFLQDMADEQRAKYFESLTSGNADDINLESGAIQRLLPGEKITPVDPKRPNVQYGQFASDLRDETAFSCGIPPEIYKRKFGSSYTASRAALNIFKKPVGAMADRYETDLNAPVFVEWLYCRVASGKYKLPGFFSDIEMQKAWSKVTFTREPMGNIDDERDANAANMRTRIGLSTIEQESLEQTGNDYMSTVDGLAREKKQRQALGINLLFDSGEATAIQVDPQPAAEAEKAIAEAEQIKTQTEQGGGNADANTVDG